MKPDVAAMGVPVKSATVLTTNSYGAFSGTSLSRPLVAGHIRQFRLPENCRIDAVLIGGDPLSRPCCRKVCEV